MTLHRESPAQPSSSSSVAPSVPPGPVNGGRSRRRRLVPDVLGLVYVVAAGVGLVLPALIHGIHLGPFDLLSQDGLLKKAGVVPHNTWVGDQVASMMPWTTLAWTQVHHAQLPLWNPYSGLGMPLAFNWQTAPFGLPALVGYLVPVQYAYTVGILVTLVVAGTGAYVLGRLLHLGVVGCTMAAVVFELSGPFVGWLGWPHAAVFSWAGWIFAAALLIVRGRRRVQSVAFFAVVLALAFYAGQPEVLSVLIVAVVVFVAALLVHLAVRDGARSLARPVLDLGIAAVAGGALAAPLALPGLQVFAGSLHSKTAGETVLPVENLVHIVLQGFDGLPISGSVRFDADGYFYLPAYVGLIAVVLAVVAVALRRRRPEVVALTAVAIISGAIAFIPFMISMMDALPFFGSVGWTRSLLPMAFALAVLAGVGVDALIRSERVRDWRWTGAGFGVAGVGLAVLYVGSTGNLSAVDRSIRARSFVWPLVEVLVGLGVAFGLVLVYRRVGDGRVRSARRFRLGLGNGAGTALLVCETVFLITAGAPLWSSSASFFTPTPAVSALQQDVGSSLVGWGPNPSYFCYGLGVHPDVNDVFAIHELAMYDPMVPRSYFSAFESLTHRSAGNPAGNDYCPALTTVSQARLYGVAYILESAGVAGPKGTTLVGRLGDEDLYHVPGSYPATLTPLQVDGNLPSDNAAGVPVAVTHPDPARWAMVTDATTPQVLRLRLTDVPGWHASLDGKPLALETYGGVMLQARIPPGRHQVELHYWPTTFSVGIVLCIIGVVGLAIALVVDRRRRGRRVLQP